MNRLSLADALALSRLDAFIEQAEADGVGLANKAEFEALVGRITAPLPTNQTSHLPADDCSHGT